MTGPIIKKNPVVSQFVAQAMAQGGLIPPSPGPRGSDGHPGEDMGIDGAIRPAHYGGRNNPYEVFKVIREWELNYFLGNALKYIRRAGKKDPSKHIEDLEKAIEHIQTEIDHLKLRQ